MQILNNLHEIAYENIPIESLRLDQKSWAEFCGFFGYQLEGLTVDLETVQNQLRHDHHPIPPKKLREGYYDDNALAYWLSGFIDALKLEKWGLSQLQNKSSSRKLLDLGCSTGRILRHLEHLLPNFELWGADINQASVQWGRKYLSRKMKLLCNSTLPLLPFASESFDAITAYSVFTHIESFEDSWILELKRLLKPKGILYLTINGESVWTDIAPGHVLHQNLQTSIENSHYDFTRPMPLAKVTFHTHNRCDAYQETVFHSRAYIAENWAPFFGQMTVYPRAHDFQDVFVFQKERE